MNSFKRIALVAALLLPAFTSAFGAPRVRDVWHAFIADGKRYGSAHTVVVRLPDGNYRITTETRLMLDVLGLNKEELVERGEYVIAPDYRPVSIKSEGKQGWGVTRFTARRRGEALEATATVAGVERARTFNLAGAIVPGPCLDDWLGDRAPEYTTGEVVILDEQACELRPAKVERIGSRESGSSWSVNMGPDLGTQRLVLDADGLRREFSAADGMVEMRRCSAEQARDITYRKLDGRDALMFPIDREIGTLDRLEFLTIELRWKDIAFDRFRLEDDRQHVVERSQQEGRYRAVVRIEPPKPIASPAHLPITGPEFAANLGESRYIKPRDPRIVAVAHELTQGKTDAVEAVKAICTWVSTNVEAAYFAETLSGPEVLACRKGTCSEFAALFASLARAAGIPTRIVLGDRIIPGQWGGHMWNEVYVGRWIPVDAGYNEVGKSFALLKFLDHDSVEGVKPLRLALPASLEIRIIDHRAAPSPLAHRFKTGIEGRVYTNAELGCRLTAPAKGWSIESKSQAGVVMIRFKVPGKDDVQIHFVAFALPVAIQPKVLLGLRRKHYESTLKGLEFLTDQACTVKGLAGQRHVFRHLSEKGKRRRADEVVWRKAGSGYLLVLSVEESVYEEMKPSFNALLESFEDLERK
jgi:Transglutaminase-like superfamily